MSMTRKEFLRSVVGAGVGVASIAALAACGDDGGSAVDAGNTCTTPSTAIGTNHGHTMVTVSLADVEAGVAKTYDLGAGTAAHTHTVMVTAQQFMQIKEGRTLNIESSNSGAHTHTVTIMCVS